VIQRQFGKTQLTVSDVGFGCARIGGVFAGGSKAGFMDLLRAAFEQGITFFDTADMYAQGESEALLGQALRGERDRVVIATKVGYRVARHASWVARVKPLVRPLIRRVGLRREMVPVGVRGALAQDFSAEHIREAAHASLRRLRTDYIDLYQLHSPPADVLARGEFLEPLERLKREGKVRYYGVACERAEDARLCLTYPEFAGLQVGVSLLHQEALAEVIPLAAARGVGVIARQCFASGLLAKPLETVDAEALGSDPAAREARAAELAGYAVAAAELGWSLRRTALQFVRACDGVSTTLVGIRTPVHLTDLTQDAQPPALPRIEWERLRSQAPVPR
jgi:aryl-alcohol dehydrogenase-like predicted oxidoreductase